MNNSWLFNGDCLEIMDKLINRGIKVDAIITDPPYQITACFWDLLIPFNNHIMIQKNKKQIPLYRDDYILQELKNGKDYKDICIYFDNNCKEGMWQKLNKLIKPNGAIVLFGSEPFSSALRMSNIKNYKYDWVWEKDKPNNFALANKRPMNYHENISVFYFKLPTYNKQMQLREGGGITRFKRPVDYKNQKSDHLTLKQGIKKHNPKFKNPKSIQIFSTGRRQNNIHPTQKPVALLEYLIKTYTNENELVLDFTCGSGTCGKACNNLNRKFIGIDNGICERDKVINGIQIKGLSWIEITKLRIDGKI